MWCLNHDLVKRSISSIRFIKNERLLVELELNRVKLYFRTINEINKIKKDYK